ncbi:MAG TPA: prohibitin family protein [Thermodesulfobacteriota bacterium]
MPNENAEPNRMRARIPEIMGGGRRGWWSWQRIVFGGIGLVVGFFILRAVNPFVIINAGERGIVLNFGAVSEKVLGEGLHFRVPVYQKVVNMNVKVQVKNAEAAAASKDLQDTHSTVALNYQVLPDKVNWIYQNIGLNYGDVITAPAVQEVVKAVTAKYTAVELITQRERVKAEVRDALKERLVTYGILLTDLSITNFGFSDQFTKAIESKQTAEQLALKAQRDLERVKFEAEQTVVNATAQAKSLALQKANVTSELVRLREVELMAKAIEKWNGVMPQVTSGAVPFIQMK